MQKLAQKEQGKKRKLKHRNTVRTKSIKNTFLEVIYKLNAFFVTIYVEQTSNEQTSTYYNMNSPNAEKAKQARQDVYYEFSPVCRPSGTAIPVIEFKNYVETKKGNQEFFAEQFKVQ